MRPIGSPPSFPKSIDSNAFRKILESEDSSSKVGQESIFALQRDMGSPQAHEIVLEGPERRTNLAQENLFTGF